MDTEFDLFDFARENSIAPETEAQNDANNIQDGSLLSTDNGNKNNCPAAPELSRAQLRQAALAFMASLRPDGIAANVPTRRSKYRVAAAGFWRPGSNRKSNIVTKTALVVMYDDLDCCFSDCAGREERIATIAVLQAEKLALEADIRKNEPHLASTDDLFGEFRSWDYSASANSCYRKLCRKLDKELKLLTQGSKLEYIRRAGNADFCYLAIPEKLIDPAVIPQEWGVVELTANPRGFKQIRPAQQLTDISESGRLQLALNIACAAAVPACFASGVDRNGRMRRPPKKRHTL
ncbi:MAG: hypothetical protein IJW35_00370 [Lentisphaeria bacterium]|nr:hypothetical protein [Lentisphaeria bacterium]